METAKAVRIAGRFPRRILSSSAPATGSTWRRDSTSLAPTPFQREYGTSPGDGIGCILQGLASPDANVRRRWAERFYQKEYLEYEPARS